MKVAVRSLMISGGTAVLLAVPDKIARGRDLDYYYREDVRLSD